MVRYWYWSVLLLLACTQANAMQPFFSVTLDTRQVEYGKSVRLTLETNRSSPSLNAISLNSLDKDFVVETVYSSARTADPTGQRRAVRLYPRHSGKLVIPALHYQELTSQAIDIQVTRAVDHKTNTPVRIENHIEQDNVWLKQAVKVTMEFETRASIIVLDTEPVRIDNFQILQIPTDHRTAEDGSNNTLHRIGWILFPTRVGSYHLQLPAIQYIRDGVTTHRFYPPPMTLEVRPLPRYVPATMPVGNMTLEMRLPEQWFAQAGKLQYLSVLLRGDGIRQQDLLSLEQQFKSTDAINYYPASTDDELRTDFSGLTSIREYRIPFVMQTSGLIRPPSLRIQYFDPDSGRIVTRQVVPESVISISRWWLYAGLVLLLAGLWRMYRYFMPKITNLRLRYRNYLNALAILEQAESTDVFKTAIQKMAGAESWPTNVTFASWLKRWCMQNGTDNELQQAIENLQQSRYGGQSPDLVGIRDILRQAVLRQHRMLRFLLRTRLAVIFCDAA
jgi:hypothetical protein